MQPGPDLAKRIERGELRKWGCLRISTFGCGARLRTDGDVFEQITKGFASVCRWRRFTGICFFQSARVALKQPEKLLFKNAPNLAVMAGCTPLQRFHKMKTHGIQPVCVLIAPCVEHRPCRHHTTTHGSSQRLSTASGSERSLPGGSSLVLRRRYWN